MSLSTIRTFAALLLLSLVAACASLPDADQYVKESSSAIRDTADTALAQQAAPLISAHPGKSGFYPLSNGVEALGARLVLARKAESSIDVQYYYILADITGKLFVHELIEAADRGVRVRMLLDDISTKGYEEMFSVLSANPNIEVRLANPAAHRKTRSDMATDFHRLNHRMHNKSVTYDNTVTIVGGRNIGAEYFGADDEFNYFDLDVAAIGPVADEVSSEFDRYWNADETIPVTAFVEADNSVAAAHDLQQRFDASVEEAKSTPYAPALQSTVVDIFLSDQGTGLTWAPAKVQFDLPYGETSEGGEPGPEVLGSILLHAAEQATQELFVVSPYFVPGDTGVERFRQLRERGVRCVVLTNSLASTDVAAVYGGYRDYQQPLLELGVELWEVMAFPDKPGHERGASTDRRSLHAKTFAIDRRRLFVGSFNWDPRSRSINTEMGVMIDSEELAGEMVANVSSALVGSAWQLRLDEQGNVVWVNTLDNGEEQVYDKPPQTSEQQRIEAKITDVKAVEGQL